MTTHFERRQERERKKATLSVSAKTYARLAEYSRTSGEPISALVERLLRPVLSAAEGPDAGLS